MEFKREKQVRFSNDGKQNLKHSWEKNDSQNLENPSPLYKVSAPLLKPEGRIGEKTRTKGSLKLGGFKVLPENHEPWRKRILDPGSEIFLQWNRIFLISCLVALFVDPLFFYLPSVVSDGNSSFMTSDLNLGIIITCFRTVADVSYLLHVIIKFRTAYVSPSSRIFGRGELVMDPKKMARRYLKSDFFIDVIATLPLPQIVIWFIIPAIRSSHADHTNNAVILGASWYLLSIERHATCWKSTCRHEISPNRCSISFLDCGTSNNEDRRTWEKVLQYLIAAILLTLSASIMGYFKMQ